MIPRERAPVHDSKVLDEPGSPSKKPCLHPGFPLQPIDTAGMCSAGDVFSLP
jgi:hypothetical protein